MPTLTWITEKELEREIKKKQQQQQQQQQQQKRDLFRWKKNWKVLKRR